MSHDAGSCRGNGREAHGSPFLAACACAFRIHASVGVTVTQPAAVHALACSSLHLLGCVRARPPARPFHPPVLSASLPGCLAVRGRCAPRCARSRRRPPGSCRPRPPRRRPWRPCWATPSGASRSRRVGLRLGWVGWFTLVLTAALLWGGWRPLLGGAALYPHACMYSVRCGSVLMYGHGHSDEACMHACAACSLARTGLWLAVCCAGGLCVSAGLNGPQVALRECLV